MVKEKELTQLIERPRGDSVSVGTSTTFHERHLSFTGAKNFRDLGGYRTLDGKLVRWKLLYRSDSLHKLNNADLKRLSALGLERVVDFRSPKEKEMQPDRLPVGLFARLVEIPIVDSSTQIYQNSSRQELIRNLKKIDPCQYLTTTNRELATRFTEEMRRFMDVVLSSNGRPILFHCTAGKDRTGFAAAILLRMLGVPQETVMEDYLLTNKYFYTSHRWNLVLLRTFKGRQIAEVVSGMLKADPSYLSAAFLTIDREHGSFENYVRDALGLTGDDIEALRSEYLEG